MKMRSALWSSVVILAVAMALSSLGTWADGN